MGRKENEKVGIFNCYGMGGNQVYDFCLLAFFLGVGAEECCLNYLLYGFVYTLIINEQVGIQLIMYKFYFIV